MRYSSTRRNLFRRRRLIRSSSSGRFNGYRSPRGTNESEVPETDYHLMNPGSVNCPLYLRPPREPEKLELL